MGDGLNAQGFEVTIAQPSVILVTRVDNPLDGLLCDFFNRFMNFLSRLQRRTRVNQHRAGRSHQQANIGVKPLVFVGSPFMLMG